MGIYNLPPYIIIMRRPKANKEHTCNFCKDPILPGELYFNATCFCPGSGFRTVKACQIHTSDDVADRMKKAYPIHVRKSIRVNKNFKEQENGSDVQC